jgi:tripartite-type tricarboxylate transporter receptor subunit TctC
MYPKIFIKAAMLGLTALLVQAAFAQGAAQGYPARTIRIIAPFPPGATLDMLSRLVAQKLGEDWGASVIVENKAGGGGVIGIDAGAKAAPDGYTFITVPNSFAANPILRKDLPYDTWKDFVPVTLLGITPHILVTNPNVPAKTTQELVALAKQQPGKLSYASFGNGTTPHLAGETLKQMAGIDIIHVPYRGQVQALTDLMGGQVTMNFGNLPDVMGHVKAGKLKAIAIASPARSALAPDIPTLAEGGLTGFTSDSWFVLMAPAKTPPEIVRKVQMQIADIMRRPDVKARLASAGVEPSSNTPEQAAAFLQDQAAKYGKTIKTANIKAD